MTSTPSFRRKPEPRDITSYSAFLLANRGRLDPGLRRNDESKYLPALLLDSQPAGKNRNGCLNLGCAALGIQWLDRAMARCYD